MAGLLMFLLLWPGLALAAGAAADAARAIRELELDPNECYRVRELTLVKEDVRLYLTDAYLIFAKPVNGTRIAAAFTTDVEGGDAEVLLMPPDRSERRSLALYAGTPNLDEHLAAGVLIFSDDSYAKLSEQIRQNPFNRKAADVALAMAERWSPAVRNIAASYETRLVLDLLSENSPAEGFLLAALSGRKLGNFDVSCDPRAREQIAAGQLASRNNRAYFDVWTSFSARSRRGGGSPPDPGFSLADYRINATVNPDLTLAVRTKLKLRAKRAGLRALPFDLAPQMAVSSVTLDGRPVEVFQRESLRANLVRNSGNSLFLVIPSEPLTEGRAYELEFEQAGQVIYDAGNKVYYVGARANWYPGLGVNFATFDLTFRYPREFDLVTPGKVVEDRTEGEWRVTRRQTAVPIRLAGFNLGHYDHERVSRGGYTVEAFANRALERALEPRQRTVIVTPPMPWDPRRRPEVMTLPESQTAAPSARLRDLAGEVAGALEFMAVRFGPPALPSLTVSPIPGTFGQGFPGLIYLSTLAYLAANEKNVAGLNEGQQMFFAEILHAHETAHQWWGNVVTADGYHDYWLMEALANYSALLYLEKRKGARSLETVLARYRDDLLTKNQTGETIESTGPIVLGTRLETSLEPRAWRIITYEKGSWIIHMLRRRMGDERFLAMLAQLRQRYERKSVTTGEFQQLAAAFLPAKSPDPKLENFFDQWVHGTGVPEIRMTYSVKSAGRAFRLSGKLTQSGVDDQFSVLVPVEIQPRRGNPVVHWVRTASEPVSFSLTLREAPARVLLDPNYSVLRTAR